MNRSENKPNPSAEQTGSSITALTTTVVPSSTPDGNGVWVEMPSMASTTQHLASSSNILNKDHPLFPLGVVVLSIAGTSQSRLPSPRSIHLSVADWSGIIAVSLGFWLYMKLSRQRRRARRDLIISFSPGPNITPYAFDSKAYNDDSGHIESASASQLAYPPTPDFTSVNVNGTGNTGDRVEDSRRVPSFYHGASTGTAGVGAGVASTIPRIDIEYLQTSRGHDDGFDTFNCAMYPAGTCPLEHEARMRELGANGLRITNLPGSPVPSFQTEKLDVNPNPLPSIDPHLDPGRRLTPPRPEGKVKHVPPPLIFSPSINGWTNSVRGFTPRRSHITASTRTSTTVSSSPSLYAPERV